MHLNDDQIQKIEALTGDLLQDIYSNTEIVPPIKLSKVLEKYGFDVKSGNFPDELIAGAYDAKAKKIYIPDSDPFARQMFTIAHELGHFFLHSEKEKDIFYRNNALNLDDTDKVEEIEANCFAASLLMPAEVFKNYWEVTKDIGKMALWFGVTQSACYWRLKNLKLIE